MRQCPPALFVALAAAIGSGGCGDEERQAPGVSPADDASSPPLAIVGAHVLHDPALEPIPDGTVLVRDGLVTALGPAGAVEVPDAATVVDGAGRWLIPGLWDMHVHLTQATERALPVLLANGVTGVRDMGGDPDTLFALRQRVRAGSLDGPRIFTPGLVVDGPKGDFEMHRIVVRTAEEGRAAADSVRALGGDFIKVHNGVPAEAYFALLDRAREIDMRVTGHIPVTVDPTAAVRAGHASIEHFVTLFEGTLSEYAAGPEALRGYMETGLDTLVDAIAATDAFFNPTAYTFHVRARRGELDAQPDPRRRYLDPYLIDYWDRFFPVADADRDPQVAEVREAFFQIGLEVVGRFHGAGIPVLAGTDLGLRDMLPGFHLHDELASLVDAGLSPVQALVAATTAPAALLDAEFLGAIAVGHRADMVLLDADPRADIGNTRRIRAVVADGRYYDREALDALLKGAARP